MICKCGRGPRNTAWRGADSYSILVLPYGVYGDRLTFIFYLCHYKESPAYVSQWQPCGLDDWGIVVWFPGGSRASSPSPINLPFSR